MCVRTLDCLHLNPDTSSRQDLRQGGTVPWCDDAKDHFCYEWLVFLVCVWVQTERQVWLGKEFFPQKSDLRGTSTAPEYRIVLEAVYEDLGLYYQIHCLPFQSPCGLLMFLPVTLDAFGFWELKCFSWTMVLGINAAMLGRAWEPVVY